MIAFTRAGNPVEWGSPYGNSGGPSTWRPVVRHADRPPQVAAFALATCPRGHEIRLSPKVHTIAADGTLSPSYVCTIPGCTFHDFVRLDGWTP